MTHKALRRAAPGVACRLGGRRRIVFGLAHRNERGCTSLASGVSQRFGSIQVKLGNAGLGWWAGSCASWRGWGRGFINLSLPEGDAPRSASATQPACFTISSSIHQHVACSHHNVLPCLLSSNLFTIIQVSLLTRRTRSDGFQQRVERSR